ncbi:MAG: amidohydrolase family protein [Candidatus Xenobia bacterium]
MLRAPDGVYELHVHLGGAVPIHRLYESAVDRGIRLPVQTYDEFRDHLHRRRDNSGSLDKYLEVYEVVERIQSGPQALREAVLIALNGAARTGGASRIAEGEAEVPSPNQLPIRGIELRLNPMKRNAGGIWDLDRVMLAASSAVEEIQTAYKGRLCAGLLVCLGRDLPWEQNQILAEKVAYWSARGLPVCGLDLAGPESAMSLSDPIDRKRMAAVFDLAGPRVGRTVHCGETRHVTLDTFLATLDALRPSRVGHPIAVIRAMWDHKDDRGLRYLAENKIVAELCVMSNLLTGAIENVKQYGEVLKMFDDYGVLYTFSTDAPALQKTTLASELQLLLTSGAATPEQLERTFTTAREATFLPEMQKPARRATDVRAIGLS